MIHFYIVKNGVRSEPLTLEEISKENISAHTMVWHKGLAEWTEVALIPELSELLEPVPPPINFSPPAVPVMPVSTAAGGSLWSGSLKKIVASGVIVAVFIAIIFSFSDVKQAEIINETQKNTFHLEQQQKLIDAQAAKIEKQERLEKNRQIEDLNYKITEAEAAVENAKVQLNNATGFKFLRSSSDRNAQINEANENLSLQMEELKELEHELAKIQR